VLDNLLQYGLFLAEVTTVVIAIGVVIRFLFNAIRHARLAEHLEVKDLKSIWRMSSITIFSTPMSARSTAGFAPVFSKKVR
jgi:hypothetical protein